MTKQCIPSSGGDELCPLSGDVVSFHTQIKVNGLLEIPEPKPDKETIFNTMHEIKITKLTTITVRQPAGKKVLLVGTLTVGIEYISDTPEQKVHFAHWDIPFQALIKKSDGSLLDLDFKLEDYVAHVCVEHEEYTQIGKRTISKEIVLLIWLQPKN